MNWQDWVIIGIIAIGTYLMMGAIMLVFLDQTPYALNPVWSKVLLWWVYLFAMVFG